MSVAVAVAGLRTRLNDPIKSIAVPVAGPRNEDARQTAGAAAENLGAKLEESPAESGDLIVVGSQPDASTGRVMVGGDVRTELDRARSSVLVSTPLAHHCCRSRRNRWFKLPMTWFQLGEGGATWVRCDRRQSSPPSCSVPPAGGELWGAGVVGWPG